MFSKIFNKKKASFILLLAILTVQLVSLVLVGTEKNAFHIDETYTYILSNSYDTNRISHDEKAMSSWNDGDYFNKFVKVEKNERFAYDKVKHNNGLDAHPPLYYYFMHTISSLFPGTFSKWTGLTFNYLLFIGIQLLLFLIATKITKNKMYGIVTVALNGGIAAVLDMALFIRMYTLLTFFIVLFVFIHCHIYENPQKNSLYLLSSIVTFFGIYTHYYFAFFAFFTAFTCCIWLLKNRNYKPLVLYASTMLCAVALVFIIYPAGINQITGSETNNIGKEVSKNIFNFSTLPSALVNMVIIILSGFVLTFLGYKIISVLCIILTIITLIIFKKKAVKDNNVNNAGKTLIVLGVLLALTIITIVHISGKFLYIRYVYYLFPLFSLFAVLFVLYIATKVNLNLKVLCIGIICLGIIGNISFIKNDKYSYKFEEKHQSSLEIIKQCHDKPLILISNGTNYHPTSNYEIIRNSSQVYILNYNKDTNIDKILAEKEINNGIVFMILTDKTWSKGFDGDKTMKKIIEDSERLKDYEYFLDCDVSKVYIAR